MQFLQSTSPADGNAIIVCTGRLGLSCSTIFYPCSACAMGQGEAAVVDPDLRVGGINRLRIADASVIPVLSSCNTQAPVIALAERVAHLLRGGATP